MYSFRFFSKLFGIDYYNPELYVAQYRKMARQTPLLYIIVITALLIVAYLNFGRVPSFLSLTVPFVLVVGDLGFLFWFISMPKKASPKTTNRAALARLHTTIWGSIGLGLAHALWAINLFEYGDDGTRGQIAVFIGVSTFGAALCLMHLRASALTIIISTIGPLAWFLWSTGSPAYMGSALNLALTSVAFIFVLNGYGKDFIRMIRQQDILRIKNVEAEALSKANFALANEDSLTGLANRRSFLTELNGEVNNISLGQASGIGVGILDLDGFKLINDVYGHPVGDKVLAEVGSRLAALQCSRVFVARLGGDEFGIVVRAKLEGTELLEIGEMFCDAMRVPFDVGGQMMLIGGSVGFANWQRMDDTAACLFEKADYALYHAKDHRRGSVTIFSQEHEDTIREVRNVDRRMQDADFMEEMYLAFQPIVAPKSASTIGFEVLARWHSPILGLISPEVFIRSAERAGTINRLTSVLLEKALSEAKNWPDDIFMSFNLSMQDITSSEAMVKLIAIVNTSGFDPKRITFEVTETSIMNDYDRALSSLNVLKSMGCKIALDDFGTGYSSLSYVRALPLDKLKLDRSFITDIETDEDAGSIVHTMVEMCQSLKLDCIVEGVETRDQLGILSAMGVEIIQGYYFSRPLSAADALAYVTDEREIKMVG